jgi:hypothetical protein
MKLFASHEYMRGKWAPVVDSLDGGQSYTFTMFDSFGKENPDISVSRTINRSERGPVQTVFDPDRFTESVELQWNF